MKAITPVWCLWALASTSLPAFGAIEVVYGDNPQESLDAENVAELRNAYEDRISEHEAARKAREAELRAQQQQALEEKEAELQQLREERRIARENAAQKRAEQERIDEEYQLSADLTKKVVNHLGPMPASLPPVASEGVEAPLNAAFNALVPLDWKVYVHQSIDDRKSISWSTNDENWVSAMYQIGVRYDFSFDINWNKRWVLVNESELRFGLSGNDNPIIEVMGTDVQPGSEGHILIDGKIIKVRRTDR